MKSNKMYFLSIAIALICAMVLFTAYAEADQYVVLTNADYVLEAGTFEGEPALLIVYQWQGEFHAFAWDKLWLDPSRPIWLKLAENGICTDADYIETMELP